MQTIKIIKNVSDKATATYLKKGDILTTDNNTAFSYIDKGWATILAEEGKKGRNKMMNKYRIRRKYGSGR